MTRENKPPPRNSRSAQAKPWSPARATREIREIAVGAYDLCLTGHAKDQMFERGLTVGDIKHILQRGFVFVEPEPATRPGYFKYSMDGRTPNSGSRSIRVVVIPDSSKSKTLKIITVMWVDDARQIS